MSVEEARKALKPWLDDMTALRSWVDPGKGEDYAFNKAFAAARKHALAATEEYIKAANAPPG